MFRFSEHSMNLDTVKHFQDDLYFRTEGVVRKKQAKKVVKKEELSEQMIQIYGANQYAK